MPKEPKFHPCAKSDLCLRKALYESYKHKCAYCGDLLFPKSMHVDHIYATNAKPSDDPDYNAYLRELQAQGFGLDKPDYIENYFPTCAYCNQTKSNNNFSVESLRFYHSQSAKHTEDILTRLESYRKRQPCDLDDFQPDFSPRYLTPTFERVTTKDIIHRETELAALKQMVREEKNIVLLSGFGGIGKTSLAKLLFREIEQEYDAVAWIPYHKSLRDSAISSLLLDTKDTEERLREIYRIKEDRRKKLVIIDNVDYDEGTKQDPTKDRDLQRLTGWPDTTVILTSRMSDIDCYRKFELDFLSEDACVDLFYRLYSREKDDAAVREMVHWANCHTMTVRLLALGAQYERSLQVYAEKIRKLGLKASEHEVSQDDKTDTIAKHMQDLFNIQKRNPAECSVLQKLSLLPAGAYLWEDEAKSWFGIDFHALDKLAKDGWVTLSGGKYSLHPTVKDIILLDALPEDCADKFLSFMTYEEYFVNGEVYTEIIRKLEIAEAVLVAAKKGDTLQIARIRHVMGFAYYNLAQYDAALQCYDLALRIKKDELSMDHLATANIYNNIAIIYLSKGDYDNALTNLHISLSIKEKKLGSHHYNTATTYVNIAGLYKEKDDYDNALVYYQKALPIIEAKLGDDHPDTAVIFDNIAGIYHEKGNYENALKYYQKALAIKENALGTDHPDTALTYHNIGIFYYDTGDNEKALAYYQKALTIREAKLVSDHPYTATTYNNIGRLYQDEGDYDKALDFYQKALNIVNAKLGEDHPYSVAIYKNIVNVRMAMIKRWFTSS